MQTTHQGLSTSSTHRASRAKGSATVTLPQPCAENSLMTIMVGGKKSLKHPTGSALLDALLSEKDSLTHTLLLQQSFGSAHPCFEQPQKNEAIAAFYIEHAEPQKQDAVRSKPIIQTTSENEPGQNKPTCNAKQLVEKLQQPVGKSQQPVDKSAHPLPEQASIVAANREIKTDSKQDDPLPLTQEVARTHKQAVEQKPKQREGLQLSKFDVTYGFVNVEDPLLFSGAKKRQASVDLKKDTMVFDYLTRQIGSFTLNKSTSSSLPSNCLRTTHLKPTEAGVHIVQAKVVLSLSNIIIEGDTEPSESQPAVANPQPVASEQDRSADVSNRIDLKQSVESSTSIIGCLSKRLDLLAEAVDCLSQDIIELQNKRDKDNGIVSSV